MSLKNRIVKAGAGLALAGVITSVNTYEAEAASWQPRTVSEIQTDIQTQANGQDGTVEYTFQWGDSLWGVSQATGISTNKLAQINNIENSGLIMVGNSVYLNENGSVVSVEDENHQVKSYDVSEAEVEETETPKEVQEEAEQEQTAEEKQAAKNAAAQADETQNQDTKEETNEEDTVQEGFDETENQNTNGSDSDTDNTVSDDDSTNSNESAESDVLGVQYAEETTSDQSELEPTSTSVLSIGESVIGTPYSYGGSTPGGFDCSGFIQWVFAQEGKSVPRTTGAQYAAATPVSDPQPGDLVFFSDGNGGVQHSAIYAGNGQFLGSQSSTGVAYESVDNPYWGPKLMGYGRI